MLLNLTYQELERVECNIKAHIKNKTRIEQENKTIKLEKEDIQVPMNFFMILFFALFYCYCWTLDKIELVHIGICIFLILFFAWFNSPSHSDKEINPLTLKDISDEDVKFSDEEMKAEMLRRLKAQYFCESNINFLNMLYYKDILNKAEKERIDGFLASKGKGILDYLSSLGERELEMFAKPYREQIAIDIEQAVRNYYEIKSKQEKSLLELVKARA